MSKQALKIAIIGGGICGSALARALQRYPHLDYHVFESKPEFKERGAGIGLDTRAVNALRAMGVDAAKMLKDAGAVEMDASRCFVAMGEHKAKVLIELPGGALNVSRARLLEQLQASLPKDRLHPGKRLVTVSRPQSYDSPCVLHFQDGTEFEADAVLGCDGIHSIIRRLILEDEYPDCVEPIFSGYWDSRATTTPQEAAEQFGVELFDPLQPTEVALSGEGAFMLFKPRDEGKTYGVVVCATAGPTYDRSAWKSELNRSALEETFKDWDNGFRTAVVNCLLSETSGPGVAFAQYESAEAPTYCKGSLCMIGDAAHAMIPWMGIGAEMAIEDATVLAALLGSARSRRDIETVLRAYDQIRRGISEYLMRKNHDAARLLTGQMSLDPATVVSLEAPKWWSDLKTFDLKTHINEGIALFGELQREYYLQA